MDANSRLLKKHWWRRSVHLQIFGHQASKQHNTPIFAGTAYIFNTMKFYFTLFITIATIFSCSPALKFKKDRDAFNASAVIRSFKSVADMNDSYFEIRENNFFEFYRQLFDSVKNSSYPGRYTLNGDTLYLNFYDKKGKELLGSKAVIKETKNEIVFFK